MEWFPLVVAALGGGVLTALANLVTARATQRRTGADVAASYQALAAEEAEENRRRSDENEGLRDELREATERLEDRDARIERQNAELMRLRLELEGAKGAFPAMLWPHLQAISSDLCHVLDQAGAFTLSEPAGGGTFRWVSESFAAGLGMSRADFIACDWRSRLHPSDRARTAAAESATQGQRVKLANRLLHQDGNTYIWVRWTSTQYLAGLSFSWVEFIDVPKEE